MARPSGANATRDGVPSQADVVVIGGGIVGVTTALFLRRAGLSVVLVEKGRVAAEQSSRNWGWIRKQGRDARELPLMLESSRQWERLAEEAGEDIGFTRAGTTYLATDETELETRAAWLEAAEGFQIDTRLLTAEETDRLIGRDDRAFAGSLHTPSDMTAEPRLAVPAFARLAVAEGVTVLEGCAARAVVRSGGRVSGIVTERGEITCDAAVLAGGAWSRTFLENMGVFIPQLAVRSTALRTTRAPQIHAGGLGATRASLRRRPDGGYTIGRVHAATFDLIPAAFRHLVAFLPVMKGRWRTTPIRLGPAFFGPLGQARWEGDEESPFERMRIMDPEPDLHLAADLLASAKALHPALKDVEMAQAWAGLIDVTPDEVPIVDEIGAPGLWVATGLSGHGFGIGPGVGRLAADLVTGCAPVVDRSPFRVDRFGVAAA